MKITALGVFDLTPKCAQTVHEKDTESGSAEHFKSLKNDHPETADCFKFDYFSTTGQAELYKFWFLSGTKSGASDKTLMKTMRHTPRVVASWSSHRCHWKLGRLRYKQNFARFLESFMSVRGTWPISSILLTRLGPTHSDHTGFQEG